MTKVELRMLTTKLAIKIFAQFNSQLIRGPKQPDAPDIAQQVGDDGNQHQRTNPHHYLRGSVMLSGYAIHQYAHHFWRDKLQNGNDDK
mgnify:CR=1 FL=1